MVLPHVHLVSFVLLFRVLTVCLCCMPFQIIYNLHTQLQQSSLFGFQSSCLCIYFWIVTILLL